MNPSYPFNYDSPEQTRRGGCWKFGAGSARAANRDREDPATRTNIQGFRLVRTLFE